MLAAVTMVGIAFALSLCSEADAFVAVSFTAFPLAVLDATRIRPAKAPKNPYLSFTP